jgi:hypothetical protein
LKVTVNSRHVIHTMLVFMESSMPGCLILVSILVPKPRFAPSRLPYCNDRACYGRARTIVLGEGEACKTGVTRNHIENP